MEFAINAYCEKLKDALRTAFGERLCYMGLQGSYLRGEATEESDIDIVVILAGLTVKDMDVYRDILNEVGDSDRACGFICSREDMKQWNPLEACQLTFTTKDLLGTLADFLPQWTRADEVNYVKMSLNNLYHALCHSYIHGSRKNLKSNLPMLYKAAFFILQNTHYLETGEFVLTKAVLLEKLSGEDRAVLETILASNSGEAMDFETQYVRLFAWCQRKQREVQ